MAFNLNEISDSEIVAEYKRRFCKKVGGKIRGVQDTSEHLRGYFQHTDREQLVGIFLNGRNEIIATEILFTGSISGSAIYVREIVKKLLKYEASALIIAHNHPSGNPSPSNQDIEITEKIKKSCEAVEVSLHDHIIIAKENFTSFCEKGLL